MTPSPGSWVGARPAARLRVVLLTMGDEAATVTMTDAVRAWAREVGADLREVRAGNDPIPAITQAIDMHADVVMSAGDALVDPLAIVTASHLDQPFLVLGGELAEPTQNVLAVDWAGAGFRGEDLGQAAHRRGRRAAQRAERRRRLDSLTPSLRRWRSPRGGAGGPTSPGCAVRPTPAQSPTRPR